MASVKLKIAQLRQRKVIGQQELADVLRVTFQSVSKWETGVSMPDITLLPNLAEYFRVSVDELLGLKPLRQQEYIHATQISEITGSDRQINYIKTESVFGMMTILDFLLKRSGKLKSLFM